MIATSVRWMVATAKRRIMNNEFNWEGEIDFLIEKNQTEEEFSWDQVIDEGVYNVNTRELNIPVWEEPQAN